MYLIMRYDELNDQYECDAHRKPICLTEDWKNWINTNHPKYDVEIYELINNHFYLVDLIYRLRL